MAPLTLRGKCNVLRHCLMSALKEYFDNNISRKSCIFIIFIYDEGFVRLSIVAMVIAMDAAIVETT